MYLNRISSCLFPLSLSEKCLILLLQLLTFPRSFRFSSHDCMVCRAGWLLAAMRGPWLITIFLYLFQTLAFLPLRKGLLKREMGVGFCSLLFLTWNSGDWEWNVGLGIELDGIHKIPSVSGSTPAWVTAVVWQRLMPWPNVTFLSTLWWLLTPARLPPFLRTPKPQCSPPCCCAFPCCSPWT